MVQAVQIRAEMGLHEDTQLDPGQVVRRRIQLRTRTVREQPEAAPRDPGPTRDKTRAPARAPSRLVDLRLEEGAERRSARRYSTQLPRPAEPEAAPSTVRIEWTRSEDEGLAVCTFGADAVVLSGTASGDFDPKRVRPPTSSKALGAGVVVKPGVSVGLDGLIYTVRLTAGDTPASVARRLAQRLSQKYRVEVEHDGARASSVRIRAERFGR